MLFTNFEKYLTKKKGAIHVGAHEGQERNWYIQQGFEKVVWFEPNKELFERLLNRISIVKGHTAFHCGVHDKLEEAVLHISNNDGQSSSILELGTHTIYHPRVHYVRDEVIKLVRLDEIFKEDDTFLSIDNYNFLNIDVQGVELNVIKSLGSFISKMDYIYTEVNEEYLYKECCLIKDIDCYLKPFGFVRECTRITPHRWGDALYIRK